MTARRLLPGDCLIAANVFKELSLNQDIGKAKRRLHMQLINQRRLGRKQSVLFFKGILGTLKKTNQKGGVNLGRSLDSNPVLQSSRKTEMAFKKIHAKQLMYEKRLRNI